MTGGEGVVADVRVDIRSAQPTHQDCPSSLTRRFTLNATVSGILSQLHHVTWQGRSYISAKQRLGRCREFFSKQYRQYNHYWTSVLFMCYLSPHFLRAGRYVPNMYPHVLATSLNKKMKPTRYASLYTGLEYPSRYQQRH